MDTNYIKVMQGLHGAGKSEYIKRQISVGEWPSYTIVISSSQYNHKVLTVTAPYLAKLSVEAFCYRKVIQAVTSGAPFIVVNDEHLTLESVAPYSLLADSYHYNFQLVTVESLPEGFNSSDKDQLDFFSPPKSWDRKLV